MSSSNLTIQITELMADFTGLEVEELNPSDHLEEDLMINLRDDLPKLIIKIARELKLEVSSSQISDFISSLEDDPDQAIFSELISFFEEIEL